MEGLPADKCLLFFVFVFVLVPIVLLRRASKRKVPPGPSGLPFIGHLHLLGTNPHQSLCNLSRIHGPLMSLRLGSVPIVVASSPSMAREILQVHDQNFSFRFQTAVGIIFHNSEDLLFSQPGPFWKLMRQICSTDLFGSKRIKSFLPLITDEVHALLRSVLHKADKVPVRTELYAASSNIISRMTVGKRLEDLARHSQAFSSSNFVALLLEALGLVGVFNVGDFIPCLAWMDLQGYARRCKAIAGEVHMLWQEVIDARRHIRSHNDGAIEDHDFLDVLMSAAEGRPEVPITDFNIRSILSDMFSAGVDTTSISTEWALSELIANPTKMKKLQDELECIVGMSRLVQATDIPHLPYLQAVVKETMRLHPPGPLLAPHKASQDCSICGYDIAAGTLAYVNVWAIGRDPDVWERPLEFSPERFLDCKTGCARPAFRAVTIRFREESMSGPPSRAHKCAVHARKPRPLF